MREKHILNMIKKNILRKYSDPRAMKMGNGTSFTVRNDIVGSAHRDYENNKLNERTIKPE